MAVKEIAIVCIMAIVQVKFTLLIQDKRDDFFYLSTLAHCGKVAHTHTTPRPQDTLWVEPRARTLLAWEAQVLLQPVEQAMREVHLRRLSRQPEQVPHLLGLHVDLPLRQNLVQRLHVQ